jgi:hypothetical protein
MMIIVSILVSLLTFSPLVEQTPLKAEWISPVEVDMGDLKHMNPQKVNFRFRNVSGDSLFIDNVRTGCGCTVPDWSYAPVPPDSISTIEVEYDTYKTGYFSEKIKVYFRGQRKADLLLIEGYVLED